MTSPAPVLDLIEAFRRSQTMFTAVKLQLFDLLSKPHSAVAVANKIGADLRATELLLDANAALGLLAKQEGIYSATDVALRYCTLTSPDTLAGYILYSRDVLWHLWGNLDAATIEGTHRWQQTFNLAPADLFNHFFQTPDALRAFQQGMHGFGQISSPLVADAFDLGRFTKACDVGGGTGHLALALHRRWPGMQVSVFDLPAVAPVAREFTGGIAEIFEGDFFSDPLPEADLYTLGRILHDWTTPKCQSLLRKIYDALPEAGGLLIAEVVLVEDRSGPRHGLLQSLNMLVCTEGMERTGGEYESLLRGVGFTSVEVRHTTAPVDAILALK